MFIPLSTLPRLSPTAAKIYLALFAIADHADKNPPAVTLPMAELQKLTALSNRTCTYALRQLRALRLIASHRRGQHAPCTYFLLHAIPQPVAGHLHNPQSLAPLAALTRNLMHPSDPHPIAGYPTPTPAAASNTHNPQSNAPSQTADPGARLESLLAQLANAQSAITQFSRTPRREPA